MELISTKIQQFYELLKPKNSLWGFKHGIFTHPYLPAKLLHYPQCFSGDWY